jgi:hypothetical protein
MSTLYYEQWSSTEIMSMHGVEIEDDMELCQDDDDTESRQWGCDCANCMDCLGLSWRDFI